MPGVVRQTRRAITGTIGFVLAVIFSPLVIAAAEPVRFNRDVRPILAQHCWRCHGFDAAARQAGLRLDERTSALRPAESGHAAIVPGKPDDSALWSRIITTNADEQMPPADAGRRLNDRERAVLRQWILEGAEYESHWAFEPIQRPVTPPVDGVTHPIDAFVRLKLQEHGLTSSSDANAETLRRRVAFALTGLPPSLEDLARIDSESYEQYVDRLLSSPHFGERMAVDWLDAARYADTDGYFGDKPRQMWLWRDGVIDAFNRNMPFDQFTIEQLAGDLLPNATIAQRIATGFNRNHMSNDETGLIDEEYRVEYVADRVETTAATWLGLTVGCAQCHDHKYDPISQREYYQIFAFFNNVPESGLLSGHNAPPRISVPSPVQQRQLEVLAAAVSSAEQAFAPLKTDAQRACRAVEADWLASLPPSPQEKVVAYASGTIPLESGWRAMGTPLKPDAGIRGTGLRFDATQHLETNLIDFRVDDPWTIAFWAFPEGSLSCPLSRIEPDGDRRGLEVIWQKGRLVVHLVHQWGSNALEVATHEPTTAKQWHHVAITYDGSRSARGVTIVIDGVSATLDLRRDTLAGTMQTTHPLRIGRRDDGLGFYGMLDEVHILGSVLSVADIAAWQRSERLRGILETLPEKRTAKNVELLLDDFIDHQSPPSVKAARDAVRQARAAEQTVKDAIPVTLVMEESATPRVTKILERGQYNKPGEAVEAGVPATLSPWPGTAPRNRLGFAQWLVAPDNPLAARVMVNRLWKQCFGEGLVRTVNDFGTQGEPPTHPELLDYLAATFRDNGWDVKALLRLIVTSQTYRQSSDLVVTDGAMLDRENRWLSRGPRFRLPMEMLRDQALAASGLLSSRIGGPSVKPYQPPGLWEDVSYNAEESYEPDRDEGLWRRSLYTYVKRQAPPPALLLFDGPTREKCTLSRPRTNTPLQALQMLNDDTYIEAARQLACVVLAEEVSERKRFKAFFRRILSRSPEPDEAKLLTGLLHRQRTRFKTDSLAAKKLLSVGASPVTIDVASDELAAWTVVAHTILNLDEALTHR